MIALTWHRRGHFILYCSLKSYSKSGADAPPGQRDQSYALQLHAQVEKIDIQGLPTVILGENSLLTTVPGNSFKSKKLRLNATFGTEDIEEAG